MSGLGSEVELLKRDFPQLGKSDQRDLRSRIQTILDHLMRLQASPAQAPRYGWERTLIARQAMGRFQCRSMARRVVPPRCKDRFAFIADSGTSMRMTLNRSA